MYLGLIKVRKEFHSMNNIINKYISENTEKSIVLEMHEYGLKQHEIMEFIIRSFKPYFQSTNLRAEQVLAYLPDYIDPLINHLASPMNKKMVKECLKIYWEAKIKNPVLCFKSFGFWQEEFKASTSKIISLINLDQDRRKMSLPDFAEDVFAKIGTLIEACIQPFLKLLTFLNRLIREKAVTCDMINQLKLGQIVGELIDCADLEDLLIPTSFNLKLNQWRNIAKHDSFSVNENKIIGKYRINDNELEVVLLKPELWFIFETVNDISSILKLTHAIFFFDNINEITPYWDNTELREESGILTLIQLFNTHGLSTKSYSSEEDQIHFELCETSTIIGYEERMNELLFLMRPIWFKSKKRYISIHYYNEQDILTLRIKTDTSLRRDIFSRGAQTELITFENIRKCCKIEKLDHTL